jgi:hypothetical protein
MSYRVQWHLVGPSDRILDSGHMDGDHDNEEGAIAEIGSLLSTFNRAGRNDDAGYWWARRSADAELEIRMLVDH